MGNFHTVGLVSRAQMKNGPRFEKQWNLVFCLLSDIWIYHFDPKSHAWHGLMVWSLLLLERVSRSLSYFSLISLLFGYHFSLLNSRFLFASLLDLDLAYLSYLQISLLSSQFMITIPFTSWSWSSLNLDLVSLFFLISLLPLTLWSISDFLFEGREEKEKNKAEKTQKKEEETDRRRMWRKS